MKTSTFAIPTVCTPPLAPPAAAAEGQGGSPGNVGKPMGKQWFWDGPWGIPTSRSDEDRGCLEPGI